MPAYRFYALSGKREKEIDPDETAGKLLEDTTCIQAPSEIIEKKAERQIRRLNTQADESGLSLAEVNEGFRSFRGHKDAVVADPAKKVDGTSQDCMICLSKPSDSVIVPCGHGGICFECCQHLISEVVKSATEEEPRMQPFYLVGEQEQKKIYNFRCHLCRMIGLLVFQLDMPTETP